MSDGDNAYPVEEELVHEDDVTDNNNNDYNEGSAGSENQLFLCSLLASSSNR